MFLKHQTFKTFLASRSTGNLVVRKKSRAPFFDEGLNLANARVQLELAPPLSWLPVLQRCNTFDIMCSTCCTMNVVARSKDQLTYATLQQFFGDDNTWKHKSSSGWCCCRKKLKSWNIKKNFRPTKLQDHTPTQSLTMAVTALMTFSAVVASSLIQVDRSKTISPKWIKSVQHWCLWNSFRFDRPSNLQNLRGSWLTIFWGKHWVSSGIQTPSASLLTWSQIKSVGLSTGSAWGKVLLGDGGFHVNMVEILCQLFNKIDVLILNELYRLCCVRWRTMYTW